MSIINIKLEIRDILSECNVHEDLLDDAIERIMQYTGENGLALWAHAICPYSEGVHLAAGVHDGLKRDAWIEGVRTLGEYIAGSIREVK